MRRGEGVACPFAAASHIDDGGGHHRGRVDVGAIVAVASAGTAAAIAIIVPLLCLVNRAERRDGHRREELRGG